MNKKVLILASALVLESALAQDQGTIKIQEPLPSTNASEWWKKSWEKGYQYSHAAQFRLICATSIAPGKKPIWFDATIHSNIGAEASMDLGGISHASTFALEGSPNPLLIRYYESIHVDRTIRGRLEIKGNSSAMHEYLFKKGGIAEITKNAVNYLAASVISFFTKTPILPLMIDASGIPAYFGDAAQERTNKLLNDNGLVITDGGFEVKKDSQAFKKLPFADSLINAGNLAVQLSEDFRNRMFILQSDSGKLQIRDGTKSADSLFSSMDNPENVKKIISGLPEPSSKRVLAVLQRETLAMNSAIFDGKQRNIGDIWTIDGHVLSGFLHPDLSGNFKGQVLLKYEKDIESRKSDHEKDKGSTYHAKVLRILPSAQTKTGTVYSNLEYKEAQFSAKINEETEATIYIDSSTFMVREAKIVFQTDGKRQMLPEMAITGGFQAVGKASLEISYQATRSKIEKSAP